MLAAACGSSPAPCADEPGSMQCARELADAEPIAGWVEAGRKPIVLYMDRSGSMRGFLDPGYPARVPTDYRSVIDRLVVGLQPAEAFGFGTNLRPSPATIDALGNRDFYSDNNTLLEQVVDRVARDTARSQTHVIVGDGRRFSPRSAHLQFERMRAAAMDWIEAGGTFMVAASLAPFAPVSTDPSGCREGADVCPLYAFVYVAPGDEARIASTLVGVFEHLFVWPMPGLPSRALTFSADRASQGISLNRQWQRSSDQGAIIRAHGLQPGATLQGRIHLSDSAGDEDRVLNAVLNGQALDARVEVRPVQTEPRMDWRAAAGANALVRPSGASPLALEVAAGSQSQPSLYKVELFPTGEPTWLTTFDAESPQEPQRTFGLDILFEAFRQDIRRGQPVARVYIVAN
jgi:hypothetical protein